MKEVKTFLNSKQKSENSLSRSPHLCFLLLWYYSSSFQFLPFKVASQIYISSEVVKQIRWCEVAMSHKPSQVRDIRWKVKKSFLLQQLLWAWFYSILLDERRKGQQRQFWKSRSWSTSELSFVCKGIAWQRLFKVRMNQVEFGHNYYITKLELIRTIKYKQDDTPPNCSAQGMGWTRMMQAVFQK